MQIAARETVSGTSESGPKKRATRPSTMITEDFWVHVSGIFRDHADAPPALCRRPAGALAAALSAPHRP
jgi:hypothetical protein